MQQQQFHVEVWCGHDPRAGWRRVRSNVEHPGRQTARPGTAVRVIRADREKPPGVYKGRNVKGKPRSTVADSVDEREQAKRMAEFIQRKGIKTLYLFPLTKATSTLTRAQCSLLLALTGRKAQHQSFGSPSDARFLRHAAEEQGYTIVEVNPDEYSAKAIREEIAGQPLN